MAEGGVKKRDEQSYRAFWKNVVAEYLNGIGRNYELPISPTAEDDIWDEYVVFNRDVSENLMHDSETRLDRHKVIACLIFAIIKVSPIRVTLSADARMRTEDEKRDLYTINERFAIRVGECLLRGFVLSHVNRPGEEYMLEYEELNRALKDGIAFNSLGVFHGSSYLSNIARALYFTKIRNTYDVLLMSDIVYQWEHATLQTARIRELESAIGMVV